MAITYPVTPPSPFRISRLSLSGFSASSRNVSPFTFQMQQYNWAGQAWSGQVELPPMLRADAEAVIGFLLSVQRGTFYFKDYANTSPRGTITGTLTVATATANTSTLTLTNTGGSGSFAVGDWLSISNSLYKVIVVTDATNVELFPVLRSSYSAGTAIAYTGGAAQGIFRLSEPLTNWSIDSAKIYGLSFGILEDVAT